MTGKGCLIPTTHPHIRLLAWHPNGIHLILPAAIEGRACGLVALSIATGATTRLTEPPRLNEKDVAPAVSPDGRRLVFVTTSGRPTCVERICFIESHAADRVVFSGR
jgi:Tol biopolymer transport system component